MNGVLQKINKFAKRFYQEISEEDVLPEYDINNTGDSTKAEHLDEKSLEELRNAQKDMMTLFSKSVDPTKENNKVKGTKGNKEDKESDKLENEAFDKESQQTKGNKNKEKELER